MNSGYRFVALIRFGDNDFWGTFVPVLLAVRAWIMHNEWWTDEEPWRAWHAFEDTERLASLINSLSFAAYRHCQHLRGYVNARKYIQPIRDETKDYLQIRPDQLVVGATAVDTFIAENQGMQNGEWFILDMRLPPDQQVFSL